MSLQGNETTEAPIKSPLSRDKNFLGASFLIFPHSADEYSENVILGNAEISTGTISSPSPPGRCCAQHP